MRKMPPADELRRLYVDEGLSTTQIGEQCRVLPATIWQWLKRCGIPVRSRAEAAGRPRIEMPPADELRRLYVDDGLSTYQMEDLLSVSRRTVRSWLKRSGIPTRSREEGMRLRKAVDQGTVQTQEDGAS